MFILKTAWPAIHILGFSEQLVLDAFK